MYEENKQQKINLYLSLLKKSDDELTDSEIDLMYLLSKDKDIQQLLNDSLKDVRQITYNKEN